MDNVPTSVDFLKIEELEFPLFLVTFKDGVRMNFEMVLKAREVYNGLSEGHRINLIVDLTGVKQVDMDARKSMSDDNFQERIAVMAIVVRDPISRMIGNFMIGLNKPKIPLQLFSSFDAARKWIDKIS